MPESDQPNHRLEDLQRRFEADPASRIYLQLADELRRLGRHPEAVEVLTAGLEQRPRDLSGLMALGRCHLEMGSEHRAAEILEDVVARDPTHIVASKLVLEAHLQRKDFDKAKQRLEIYRLLNDRDPELDHLQFRLDKLREDPSEVPTEVLDQHNVFDLPVTEQAASPVAGEQIFQVAATRGKSAASGSDVFDFLSTAATAQPLAEPAADDIFAFLGRRPAVAESVLEITPPATEIQPAAEPEEAAVLDEAAEPEESQVVEATQPAELEPVIAEPEPDVASAEADVSPSEIAEPAQAEAPIEAESAASESTVTLAELYLEQGHLAEAEEIFQDILQREPENAAARAGMRQIEARVAGELTATELLVEAGEPRPRGLTERKVTVLKRYLQRLRGAPDVR